MRNNIQSFHISTRKRTLGHGLRMIVSLLITWLLIDRSLCANETYEVRDDFVYKVSNNIMEKPFNPNSILIAKKVSLSEIRSSLNTLALLIAKFNHTCHETIQYEEQVNNNREFQLIYGHFNFTTAKRTCKLLGKVLIEIRTPADLLRIIQLANGKKLEIPIGAKFSNSISNYTF